VKTPTKGESGIMGATAESLNVPQSEESVLSGRTETYGFGVQDLGKRVILPYLPTRNRRQWWEFDG